MLRFQPTSVPWDLIILLRLLAGRPQVFQVVSELSYLQKHSYRKARQLKRKILSKSPYRWYKEMPKT